MSELQHIFSYILLYLHSGKTLQTISFLGWLRFEQKCPGPYLVVVPLSVLSNWDNEFKRFLPDMRVLKLHSSDSKEKDRMRKEMLHSVYNKYDVVITTYDILKSAELTNVLISRIYWKYVVFDEGHILRHEKTTIAATARRMHFEYVILLTGTPLQNDLHELWSLLNFLQPDIFISSAKFDECFNISNGNGNNTNKRSQIDYNLLLKAHAMLKPFMLRRIKNDVANLPKKIEKKILCPLTPMQTLWYKRLLLQESALLLQVEKSVEGAAAVAASDGSASRPKEDSKALQKERRKKLKALYVQLRKVCNHPFLFEEADEHPEWTDDSIIAASGKLLILDRLLQKLKEKNNRVVIFSQYTRVLAIIGDYLAYRGYEFCRLDGSTNRVQRQISINMFNAKNSPYFAFIMTTRAGGLGVNLQTADTVILYDSDWNPQADAQAMARVHRIGQKKEVHVYRLVTSGTVEERIVQRAENKLFLDQMVNRDSLKEVNTYNNNGSGNPDQAQPGETNDCADIENVTDDDMNNMGSDQLLEELSFGADVIINSTTAQLTDNDIDDLICRQANLEPSLSSSSLSVNMDTSTAIVQVNQKVTAKDYVPDSEVLDTRNFQGSIYHKYSGGALNSVAASTALTTSGGSAESRKTSSRVKKSRLRTITDEYGNQYDVIASNMYDMQSGEKSVFEEELKDSAAKSKASKGPTRRKGQVAGRDYDNEDHCLVCWDGGDLICCDRCPASYHDSCLPVDYQQAQAQNKTGGFPSKIWVCPHHFCMVCFKAAAAVGGTLFRCSECSNCFCEEHLPNDAVINGRCLRLEKTGYTLVSQACYIFCSETCATFSESYDDSGNNGAMRMTLSSVNCDPLSFLSTSTDALLQLPQSQHQNQEGSIAAADDSIAPTIVANTEKLSASVQSNISGNVIDQQPPQPPVTTSTSTAFSILLTSAASTSDESSDPIAQHNKLISELISFGLPNYFCYDRCRKCLSIHEHNKCEQWFVNELEYPTPPDTLEGERNEVLVTLFQKHYKYSDAGAASSTESAAHTTAAEDGPDFQQSISSNQDGTVTATAKGNGLRISANQIRSFMHSCSLINLGKVFVDMLNQKMLVIKHEKRNVYVDIHPDYLPRTMTLMQTYFLDKQRLTEERRRQEDEKRQLHQQRVFEEQKKLKEIESEKFQEIKYYLMDALSRPKPRRLRNKGSDTQLPSRFEAIARGQLQSDTRLYNIGYHQFRPFTMSYDLICVYLLDESLSYTQPINQADILKAVKMLVASEVLVRVKASYGSRVAHDDIPAAVDTGTSSFIPASPIRLYEYAVLPLISPERKSKQNIKRNQFLPDKHLLQLKVSSADNQIEQYMKENEEIIDELTFMYMTNLIHLTRFQAHPQTPPNKIWAQKLQYMESLFLYDLSVKQNSDLLLNRRVSPYLRDENINVLAYVPTFLEYFKDVLHTNARFFYTLFLIKRRVLDIDKATGNIFLM